MAKLRVLMETVSTLTSLPFPSVEMHARPLRKARLLSTGAKGVNAPEIVASDISNLIISMLAGSPTHAETLVREAREFKVVQNTPVINTLLGLPDEHDFGNAVDSFIDLFSDINVEKRLLEFIGRGSNKDLKYVTPMLRRVSYGRGSMFTISFYAKDEDGRFSTAVQNEYYEPSYVVSALEKVSSISNLAFWTSMGALLRAV